MSQIYSFSADFILHESVGSKYIPLLQHRQQQQINYGFTLEWKKHFEQIHPPSLLAELKVIEFNVDIQRIQCKYTRPHSNGEIGTFGFKPNKTKNYYIQNNKISLNFCWSKIGIAETQTQNDNVNRSRISLSSSNFVFSPLTLMENLNRIDRRMSMPSFFQQQQPRNQDVLQPPPATNRRLLFGIETIDEEEENENQENQDPAQQQEQLLSDITIPEAIIDLPDENETEIENDEEEFGSLESALNRARIFDPEDAQIFGDDDIENENIQPPTTRTSLHPFFNVRHRLQQQGRQSLVASKITLTHALSQERQRRRRRQSFASASSRFTNNNNNNGVVDADERQQQQQLPFTFSRRNIPLTSTPNNRHQILRERNYLSQPSRISGIGTFLNDQTRNLPPKKNSSQFGIPFPQNYKSAQLGPSSPLKTFSPNTKTNETPEDDTEKRQSIILDNARNSLKFSDVIFLTTFDSNNGNNSQKIYANRCIIYGQSKVFDYLFEEKQSQSTPIKINLNFPAEIVMRAIQFFYGKNDAIKNFENELLDFAETYSIDKLKLECLKVLPLKIEDICENTNFAFKQSDDEFLKQKCLKFLKENKKQIGKENFKLLPLEALVELAF